MSFSGRFKHYRWLVLIVAVALEVGALVANYLVGTTLHPLAPVGAAVVFISIIAAGFGGIFIGLFVVAVGIATAFPLLGDFASRGGTANAIVSAFVWLAAATASGLTSRHYRRQVVAREAVMEEALDRSLRARETLWQILEFSPDFHRGNSPAEVAKIICDRAIESFSADGARLYAFKGELMEIVGISGTADSIRPGFFLGRSDFPDLEDLVTKHWPSFTRDVRDIGVKGAALELQQELLLASVIRIALASPTEPIGVLGLGWERSIERPDDEDLAVMQSFGDQAAIAWQDALRLEAKRQADSMHETLQRVVTLAPTFHITGSREEVARAVCEASLKIFECTGAVLCEIEGDRLRVLSRRPATQSPLQHHLLPLSQDTLFMREFRSRAPVFIADTRAAVSSIQPWPLEVADEANTRSVLFIPARFEERGPRNVLVLTWDQPIKEPDDNLLVIIERFADQLTLALTNASLERLHARLEASLLPGAPVNHPDLQVMTRYQTGEQRLRLGGDFVGSTASEKRGLDFVIGDVSGHGPDAAALAATLRSTWNALALAGTDISEAVGMMQQVLLQERAEPGFFATVLVGHVDLEKGTLSIVNAGHPPPLLLADAVTPLEARPVLPLGFNTTGDWPLHRFALPPRWSLFCYTDGLIEAQAGPGSPGRYGEERLRERLRSWTSFPAAPGALDELLAEVRRCSGGHFADDVAVLVVSTKNGARTPPK